LDFQNMKKMQSFNENMLGKFLGFGRMKTNFFCFFCFFFKYFEKNRVF